MCDLGYDSLGDDEDQSIAFISLISFKLVRYSYYNTRWALTLLSIYIIARDLLSNYIIARDPVFKGDDAFISSLSQATGLEDVAVTNDNLDIWTEPGHRQNGM